MHRLQKWLVLPPRRSRPRRAFAQAFLSRPVTLIVPWPAGGSTDQVMRALATATEKYLGQPIVVENKPGAGGTLGATAMVDREARRLHDHADPDHGVPHPAHRPRSATTR